jgi:hypothetical protein
MIAKGRGISLVLVLLLSALFVRSQQFNYQSSLGNVTESGFYKIPINLDWSSVLMEDLADLRIVDDREKHVAYIVRQKPSVASLSFVEFPIVNNATDSSHTTLELDARAQQGIDHLSVVMSNHSAERYSSLSGSDNQKQWFIIDEKIFLENARDDMEGRFVQQIRFPFIRYPYLKLKINNNTFDPLNILRAGVFIDTAKKESSEFQLHPPILIDQKDSLDGNTYVWIHHNTLLPIDRITIGLEGERYFKRRAEVYSIMGRKQRRLLTSADLLSGKEPAIPLPGGKVANLVLVIYNGGNPPLKVTSVNTQSKKDYLIAYLEKGKQYRLIGGSSTTSPPQYDLSYFKDSIPRDLPILESGTRTPFAQGNEVTKSKDRWWLWPSIIAMLVVLALVTFKMVKEVKDGV